MTRSKMGPVPALALALALGFAPPLGAQETSTAVTLAGSAGIKSGDEGRLDDHEGYRNGLLAMVQHQSQGLSLDLKFEPTTAGWLDVAWRPDGPFRFELHLDRSRRYSDTSIRPDTTPLGTPVSSFYPGTNTLAPLFGDDDQVETRTRLKLRAAYIFGTGVVDFTLRGTDLRGERVPEAQGTAFGDLGAPAFFSPGLTSQDAQEWEAALGTRVRLLSVDWSARAGFGKRKVDTAIRFPVWGASSLLELSRFATGHDADFVNALLTASKQLEAIQIASGVSYDKTNSTPSFEGGANAQTPRDVLSGGSSKVTRKDAAGSVSVQPWGGLDMRVAGRIGREETEASGVETLISRAYVLDQSQNIDRWSVRGQLGWAGSGLRIGLLGGRDRSTNGLDFRRAASLVLEENVKTRDNVRGEVRFRANGLRLALSGGRRWDKNRVDIQDIVLGYSVGNRDGTFDDITGSISGTVGTLPFTLSAASGRGVTDLEPPTFEPNYDPSWLLVTSRAGTRFENVIAHLATPGGSAVEAWAEAGWRRQRWTFDDGAVLPGFAGTDEEVRGITLALGATVQPAAGWAASLSGWLDAPSGSVEHRAWRADASVERTISKALDALLRVQVRRFDQALYRLDDYTLTSFTLGVRGHF